MNQITKKCNSFNCFLLQNLWCSSQQFALSLPNSSLRLASSEVSGRLTDSATKLFWDSSVSQSRLRWLCNPALTRCATQGRSLNSLTCCGTYVNPFYTDRPPLCPTWPPLRSQHKTETDEHAVYSVIIIPLVKIFLHKFFIDFIDHWLVDRNKTKLSIEQAWYSVNKLPLILTTYTSLD